MILISSFWNHKGKLQNFCNSKHFIIDKLSEFLFQGFWGTSMNFLIIPGSRKTCRLRLQAEIKDMEKNSGID